MRFDVFLSYCRADIKLAQQVCAHLEEAGKRVWWDRRIPIGAPSFPVEIEKAILASQCVLVLWTNNSRESPWVMEEAVLATQQKIKVMQLCERGVSPPLGFRQIQCRELTISDGEFLEAEFQAAIVDIIDAIGITGRNEHLLSIWPGKSIWDLTGLAIETPVPGLDIFLSFRPCGDGGIFLPMRLATTDGWVRDDTPTAQDKHRLFESDASQAYVDAQGNHVLRVSNEVLFIMDPLRPYGVQIGELRSKRPSADPGVIIGQISEDQLEALPTRLEWVAITLAEILSNERSLEYLWHDVENNSHLSEGIRERIKKTISRNPNAPPWIQKTFCAFCDDVFKSKRMLPCPDADACERDGDTEAYVIANDFPFGPAFHYLAITEDAIHSWEDLEFRHIRAMNGKLHRFLRCEQNRRGALGAAIGFNSTIRHLILGSQTRSSAGASMPHVHKQAWGLVQKSTNLAERLIVVSQAYWNHNVDYQGAYLSALRKWGYVIWDDKNVALYVPYGQCSKHEMQAMVLHPRACFTDLTPDEVNSLSKAEHIALCLFRALGINSFNEVVLTKLFNDNRAPMFRFVVAFITREVDLAVSELSQLFVVDQHPWESRTEIEGHWKRLRDEVLRAFA